MHILCYSGKVLKLTFSVVFNNSLKTSSSEVEFLGYDVPFKIGNDEVLSLIEVDTNKGGIGKCQNWIVSESEIVRIGQC